MNHRNDEPCALTAEAFGQAREAMGQAREAMERTPAEYLLVPPKLMLAALVWTSDEVAAAEAREGFAFGAYRKGRKRIRRRLQRKAQRRIEHAEAVARKRILDGWEAEAGAGPEVSSDCAVCFDGAAFFAAAEEPTC